MSIGITSFSFFIGLSGAWFALRFSEKVGVTDIPNHRSSHTKGIPRGGGVGILLVVVFVSLILRIPMFVWVPSMIISLASFWGGDKHRLSVNQRLIVQFSCAFFFIFSALSAKQAAPSMYMICVPIAVFIVGTANFYNFMDGIDGIAGITGIVAFSLLAFYNSGTNPVSVYMFLELAIVSSCAGFLCLNFPKAKVFLGDIGSVFLGFIFAIIVVIKSENVVDFLVMSGFLSTFYFDELSTMYIRMKNGESLIKAHRKHTYQMMANELGIDHWKVSLIYGCYQLLIGSSVIYVSQKGVLYILLAYLIYGVFFMIVSNNLRKRVVA